jgi:hypothetical protein
MTALRGIFVPFVVPLDDEGAITSRNCAAISIGLLSAGSTVSMPMVQPENSYDSRPKNDD